MARTGGGARQHGLAADAMRRRTRRERVEDTPRPARFPRATGELPTTTILDGNHTKEDKSTFDRDAAAIGHDIKSPLSVIALEIAVLNDHVPPTSGVVTQALGRIRRNLTFIDHMVHDLLDLASLDAQRLELDREPIELVGLVQDVVERMVASTELHRVHVEANGVVMVYADARRIERVVANLVTNALKYAPRDSEVWVRVEVSEDAVRVSVIDQGPGLAPDDARRVFDKYERIRATGRRAEGTGLGLYVCRRIVEEHHGRVGVESALGRGSRFFFVLPLLRED